MGRESPSPQDNSFGSVLLSCRICMPRMAGQRARQKSEHITKLNLSEGYRPYEVHALYQFLQLEWYRTTFHSQETSPGQWNTETRNRSKAPTTQRTPRWKTSDEIHNEIPSQTLHPENNSQEIQRTFLEAMGERKSTPHKLPPEPAIRKWPALAHVEMSD